MGDIPFLSFLFGARKSYCLLGCIFVAFMNSTILCCICLRASFFFCTMTAMGGMSLNVLYRLDYYFLFVQMYFHDINPIQEGILSHHTMSQNCRKHSSKLLCS